MHYPISFLETQASQVRGGYKALKAGQWDSGELRYLTRYAAFFGAMQVASVLFNTDFNRIAGNENINRLNMINDSLTSYDDDEKMTFGLLSSFAGVGITSIPQLLYASGIANSDKSDLEKILFGNTDWANNDDYKMYLVNSELGRWSTKIGPAIQDGRGWDAFRHWMKAYPSKQTKEYNKALFGEKKVNDPRAALIKTRESLLTRKPEDTSANAELMAQLKQLKAFSKV